MTIPDDARRQGAEGGSERTAEPRAAPQRRIARLPIPLVVIAAGLLIAAAAYTAYWMVAAAQLEARVAGWIEDRRAEGVRIDHGPFSRSGFPGRLRLAIAPMEVATPAGWTWRAPRLAVEADPLAPRALRFSLFGKQELDLPFDHRHIALNAEAARLDADVVGGGGMIVSRAVGEQVTLRSAGAAEAESLRIGRIEVSTTPGPAATASSAIAGYRVTLVAGDVGLPASDRTPLGDRIAAVSLLTEVTGDVPDDVKGMPWPRVMARWRDNGGTVEIRGLSLDYGPLRLSGDGTLALDKTGEPIGAFSLRATGLVEALRVLADGGLISPMIAAGAALVFRPPPGKGGNGDASVSLPASLQDGKLFLGPLAIARIPSPPWVPLPEAGS